MPKKPKNAFQLFISDRISILLKNKQEINFSELFKQIVNEWKKQTKIKMHI